MSTLEKLRAIHEAAISETQDTWPVDSNDEETYGPGTARAIAIYHNTYGALLDLVEAVTSAGPGVTQKGAAAFTAEVELIWALSEAVHESEGV